MQIFLRFFSFFLHFFAFFGNIEHKMLHIYIQKNSRASQSNCSFLLGTLAYYSPKPSIPDAKVQQILQTTKFCALNFRQFQRRRSFAPLRISPHVPHAVIIQQRLRAYLLKFEQRHAHAHLCACARIAQALHACVF